MKLLLSTALALAVVTYPLHAQLGRIEFPTSARSPRAQAAFLEGVLLLHSFEYEDAREAFQRAREIEPGFAMATWGEALTDYNPIWRRERPDRAREALAVLGADPAERASKAGTDLERAWLGTVETLFGEGTRAERWTGYRDGLAELRDRYPHDVEIGALYALSILGTSFRDRDVRIYMQAAGVAQSYYHRYPEHPGLLHYLIHCYDDPIHAPLGLPMARRYDKIAPSAGHALHMPSHIYVALGMWQESIRANEASFRAGDERRARKQLGVDERNWHACQWLAYSYLQRGRVRDAAKLLDTVRQDLEQSSSTRMRYHVIVMRAAHLIDSGAWEGDDANFEVDLEGLRKLTAATEHFALALSSLSRRDPDTARRHLDAVTVLAPTELALEQLTTTAATCCAPSGQTSETVANQLAVLAIAHQLEGALATFRGKTDEAIAALREACRHEDAMGFDFGPPEVPKPAHEMLGELLLQAGRAEEAVPEFEAALLRAPGRARALLGLARAHERAGHADAARAAYRELAELWRIADPDLPDLAEVREAAGAR